MIKKNSMWLYYISKARISFFTNFVLIVMLSIGFFIPSITSASSFTSVSDTLSSQAPSTASDHTFGWTLYTGHTTAVNAVITIDLNQSDFVASGTWQTSDFAFTDNVRSAAAPASVGTGAATCSGSSANNYIVNVTAATSTFVITTCTGWTTSSAAVATTFKIFGTTATGSGVLTNQTNVDSSVFTITNSVNDTDSGTGAVAIETNDVVTVNATVNPTLTFSISSATVNLGTLTTSTTATGSHTVSVATNGSGGFAVTYNGATLTSGSNIIAAYPALSSSAAGTAGFGINLKLNTSPVVGAAVTTNAGTCGIATNYNTANSFSFATASTTAVTSVSAPADCVYTVSYIANIASTTPAGTYSTALTYIATGTF